MDYNRIYNKLISNAQQRIFVGYVEKHHIIPRCLGGTDDKQNIVDLTPEEHFVAHQLLVKIYPDNDKLIYATHMMTRNSGNQKRNNKMYGWLRRKYALTVSKNQTGKGNSQYGSMWIHNIELKENKKISKNEDIPTGWKKGRKFNWEPKIAKCKECQKEYIQSTTIFCSNTCRTKNASNTSKNKKHSKESKRKISESAKKRTGKNNNQYGTIWINNNVKNKKIKKDAALPKGWKLGRKKYSPVV